MARLNLLDHVAADARRQDVVRGVVATVTAVSGRLVTLDITGGAVAGIPAAKAYATPAVGDVVLVLKLGDAWLALTALG